MVGYGGGGGIRNGTAPPLELTNLAAAANTVVETDMAFLCLFGFLLQLYHEPGWAEPGRAGPGWVGPGCGCVKVRGVLMRAGLWGPFPPCAVNINTHFTVNTAAAGPSGPGCPFPSLPSSGLRSPGPALRQTSTCVCMVRGM